MTDAAKTAAGDAAILELARERFLLAVAAEDKRRQRQLFDYKFSLGKKNETESYQFSQADIDLRKGRPMITNNRIGPHCRQTGNQILQADQGFRVAAIDNGADPEKAEVRQGVFRLIESRSTAPYVVPTDHQIRMGEGFVRVVAQYVGVGPLQELRIKGVRNRFSVYADPASIELDGSDWEWLFITEDLLKKTYDKKWPKTTAASLTHFASYGDEAASWFIGGRVRIAEYFYCETVYEAGDIKTRKVSWVKMNGIEILSRQTLKIPMIPVARFIGEVIDVEGEVDYRGAVTDSVDPQKMLNYCESATAEAFGIVPKAPYAAYAASIAGHPEWDDANAKNYSVLTANTVDPDNKAAGLLPLPMRNNVTPQIEAMVVAGQRAENNLRASLGVVDVDASERAKEQSGRAIKARQQQNDITNSHFALNQSIGKRRIGQILDAWVPFIYDTPRVMEIMGADDQRRTVMIHAGQDMAPQQLPSGVKPEDVYDLTVGRYDIEIATGPSYATQRQNDLEVMTQVVTGNPELMPIAGDLFFGAMDSPVARQMAQRLKKAGIKSGAIEDDDKDKQQPEIPPQVKAQMDQLQKQHELLVQELTAKTQEVETQQAKAQADAQVKTAAIASDEKQKLEELASAEKIAAAKLEQEFRLAVMKMENDRQIAALKAQQAHDQMIHQAVQGDQQRQHEADQGQQERQQDRDLHDSDLHSESLESQATRDHEMTLAEKAAATKANGAEA